MTASMESAQDNNKAESIHPADASEPINPEGQTTEEDSAIVQEALERKRFVEEHGFEPLNELLSFHLTEKGDVAYIHLGPARTIPKEELTLLVGAGLIELAQRMQDVSRVDLDRVTKVGAISWIVTKRPEWLEFLGFTIDGPISEHLQKELFPDAKIPINTAHIDKDKFLSIYGS